MARIIRKEACPQCRSEGRDRSGDNLSVYSGDNGAFCFVCHYAVRSLDRQRGRDTIGLETEEDIVDLSGVQALPVAALKSRLISAKVAAQYGVRVEYDTETGLEKTYYFPVYSGSELVGFQAKPANAPGQRKVSTNPFFIGSTKGIDPFGAHTIGDGGKFVIATEGAEDALATVELLAIAGKKYRVVATLGTSRWKSMLPWFQRFAKVVIAFDQDEAGQTAAREFAEALSPGQGVIATWAGGANDPNDMLRAGHVGRLMKAINEAKPLRPDGIITGEEVWHRMESYVAPDAIEYPAEWPLLQAKTGGLRRGEISLWTAGTSVGKTSFVRRLKSHVIASTLWRVGEIELEEASEKTWRGLMEFVAGKRWDTCSPAEKRAAYDMTYGTGRIATLEHRAQYGRGQSLMGKLKGLVHEHRSDLVVLDHITLAVTEFGDGEGLAAQDRMMSEFLEFVESTDTHLCLISHLRKTSSGGKSFEEGAVPTLDDMKGSGSLKQLAFDVIGVSRNTQAEEDYERDTSQLHILKCRASGMTGRADKLHWNRETRQLEPWIEPDVPGEEGRDF